MEPRIRFRKECDTNEEHLDGSLKIQYIEWLEARVKELEEENERLATNTNVLKRYVPLYALKEIINS